MYHCEFCGNLVLGAICKCGAEYRLVVIHPPTVNAEELKAMHIKQERETYDKKGNRIPV